MKTINSYVWILLASCMTLFSCSNDIDNVVDTEEPSDVLAHFDIWVSIGENTGMGASGSTQLVKSVSSLEAQTQIDFKNEGADVTAKLNMESIIRGNHYYQIPKEKDRFGKYQIVNDGISIKAEFPFTATTLKDRRFTHAWVDDKTLILIGSNGNSDKIVWIKVDGENMKNLAEGELDLPEPAKGDKFNTSGIASFHNGKIFYSFVYNKSKTKFYTAFIDAATMKTEKIVEEDRAEFMAGTAYGELLQNKTFFTPNGDYYMACNSVNEGAPSSTQQHGALLRIKNGTTDYDKTYRGYNYERGKIVTADCINSEKALLYIQDPVHTGAAGWGDDYNCYYAILNLKTDELEEIKYNGSVLPYSSGMFSQRSIVLNDKVYIGVNPKEDQPCIYIYDIKSGDVVKGLTITKGYAFDRIVALQD